MGCASSIEGNVKSVQKIVADFKKAGVPEFDSLFEEISKILKECEEIREGIDGPREDGMKLSNCHKLVEASYNDVVQVLLWALSVDGNGKILNVELTIEKKSPYISVDNKKTQKNTDELYESFKKYIENVTTSPLKLKENVEKLAALQPKVGEAFKAAKEKLSAGSMGFKEKAECLMAMSKSLASFPKEVAKCKGLLETLKEAGKDLQELVPRLPDLVKLADETGAKAVKAEHKTLELIFHNYIAGERKKEFQTKDVNGKVIPPPAGLGEPKIVAAK